MAEDDGRSTHPDNIKGFLRYRWMSNYLAVPMMIDRHTAGLRGTHLKIAHTEYDLIAMDAASFLTTLFRADKNCGNDQELSKSLSQSKE